MRLRSLPMHGLTTFLSAVACWVVVVCSGVPVPAAAGTESLAVVVNVSHWVYETSPNFVSLALDGADACGTIRGLLGNSSLMQLAKGFGGGYLRMGASCDRVLFGPRTDPPPHLDGTLTPCYFSPDDWDELHQFVQEAGWGLIFGLSGLLRDAGGPWNDTNARRLFEYTQQQGYTVSGWELGNEPDLYPKVKNATVAPKQMAADFESLAALVKDVFGPAGASMKIFGPDVATLTLENWYTEFLESISDHVLSAVTVHFYYLPSTASVQDFVNATVLDHLGDYVRAASRPIRQYLPTTRLWLGETSSSYDGGTVGVSESYAVVPMWVDKLGLAGRLGVDGIIKQDLIGENYGLLTHGFLPTPTYWVSVLFKRVAGNRVLRIADDEAPHRLLRSYARCAAPDGAGAVLLLLVNVDSATTTLTFPTLSTGARDQYVFTEGTPGNLTSATLRLNGRELLGLTPDLSPVTVNASTPLTLTAFSAAFLVFHDAQAPACS